MLNNDFTSKSRENSFCYPPDVIFFLSPELFTLGYNYTTNEI